jgi:hypothetical protein
MTNGTGERVLVDLMAAVPEFAGDYPITIVMDLFAETVLSWAREGTDERAVDRALAFVEQLAASEKQQVRNLVTVCFLEGINWEALGVAARFGPATRRLAEEMARS